MKILKLAVCAAVLLGLHALSGLAGIDGLSGLVGHAQSPCPVRGSCNLEPSLQGRTDLLLFEDFELADWQSHWTGFDTPTNLRIVTSPVQAGSRALEVLVPTGAHDGASLNFAFSGVGVPDPEELYFRYWVRFNDSWQRNNDGQIGKFPGFDSPYGTQAGHGCNPSNGTNGWSARMMNWDRGSVHQIGFYTYHADMTSTCGEAMAWAPMLERNRWYKIEAHVRVNTINGTRGNNDGVLEGWVDDTLAFRRTDLRFRDVDRLKIQQIWANLYVGGEWVADRNMAIHFDNMVVARNRIGGGGSVTAPNPPTNLRIISE